MVFYAYVGLLIAAVAFLLSLYFLFRDSLSNPLEFKFASKQGKAMVAVVISAFLVMVSSTAYIALDKIRTNVELSLKQSLGTVLNTTHQSLRIWVADREQGLQRMTRDPEIFRLSQQLINDYKQENRPINQQALQQIRQRFSNIAGEDQRVGFFVINVNGINVASMRDNHLGEVNPILIHRPELFARVLNGESILVHAISSDEPIENQRLIKNKPVPPTMFIASPILNRSQEVIAVLAERYNPHETFSEILKLGRLGRSGETYAFNSDAYLVSGSRFDTDLISQGFLLNTEQSILSVRVVEPSANGELSNSAGSAKYTRMAANALQKNAGIDVQGYSDYRGVTVVGAWLWDEDLELGLTTEQDYQEAFISYQNSKWLILILLISTSLISVGYTFVILFIGNRATNYLENISDELEESVAERTHELGKSERMLQLVVDTVPAPIYLKDLHGHYELINSAFEKAVNVTRAHAIGKTDLDIMPADIGQKLMDDDQRVMNDGEGLIADEAVPLPSGQVQYFQSFKNPIFDYNGQVIGLAGVSLDITDREATSNALKDTLQSLSFVQYVVDDAAYLVLWGDSKTGVIEYGNRAAEALLKVDTQQLNAMSVFDIDAALSEKTFAAFIDDVRDGPQSYEADIVATDGTEHPMEITSQVIRFGEKERLVIFGRDISVAKNLQRELIKSKEKAEEASLAKSEFLASMSHEIRTPLNGVLGMIGLVRKTKLKTDQDDRLRIAQNSATSLLSIINDLLDFSKIEAHKMSVESLDFNVSELLDDVIQSMAFKAEEKGIGLTLEMSGLTAETLKSDPTRIRQILVNLIGNAIKFTHAGAVTVVASTEMNAEQLYLTCHVKDTGVGIEAHKLAGLFEKFTQADSTVTRKYGGTGLGLAISQKLCELLRGTIQVSSELGRGSDFSFSIQVEKSDSVVKALPDTSIEGMNVLVVDDIEINRIIFKSQVESWGANVIEANSADTALAQMNAQATNIFDFILLDMNMPNTNGLALAKMISENPSWQTSRLIMMTSTTEMANAQSLLDIGISGYFSKPVKPVELHNALKVIAIHGDELLASGVLVNSQYLESLSRLADRPTKVTETVNTQLKILLVEDNEINQLIVKGMLENFNLTCHAVFNGQEAIDYIKNLSQPSELNLILMDCQMPVLDGYAATVAIRGGEAGDWAQHVPIVAMTANALAGDKEKCLAFGMNDFVTKPVSEEEFKRILLRYSRAPLALNKAETETNHRRESETQQETVMTTPAVEKVTEIHWPAGLQMLDPQQPPAFAKFASAYLAALTVFVQQPEDAIAAYNRAFETGDFTRIKDLAHGLKGSSANLGFKQLHEQSAAIEANIKEQTKCDAQQINELGRLYAICVADAQAVIQAANKASAAQPESFRAWQLVRDDIVVLLEDSQVVSTELIDELNAAGKAAEQAVMSQVVEALNNFEYDEALTLLKEL